MADIDAFEFITDDKFDEAEQGAVEGVLHNAFGMHCGAASIAATGDDGEPLDLHIDVAVLDAPRWVVHLLRRVIGDDQVVSWESVWATTDVFYEHEWVPGGEDLECAECGDGLGVHRESD